MSAEVRARLQAGEKLPVGTMKIPMVDLPLGATEDRVCGTIDIEKALTEGASRFLCPAWGKPAERLCRVVCGLPLPCVGVAYCTAAVVFTTGVDEPALIGGWQAVSRRSTSDGCGRACSDRGLSRRST